MAVRFLAARAARPATLLALVALAACPSEVETDSDTDDPGSVASPYTGFVGEVTYSVVRSDRVVCDADVTLWGTPYTGTCPGCEFAFAMDAEIARDEGSEDCFYSPVLTYLPIGAPGERVEALMGFAPSISIHGSEYRDVFMSAITHEWDGYTYGPYWYYWLSYDGSPYGTFARDGDVIDWTHTTEYGWWVMRGRYGEYCGPMVARAGDGSAKGTVVGGTLPCGSPDYVSHHADVFTFEAPEGALASVAVDTVAPDSAFTPYFLLIAPDTCLVNGWFPDWAEEGWFDCTHPAPSGLGCPAWEVETVEGSYTVVVGTSNDCDGAGAYELRVELRGAETSAPEVVLVADDVDPWDTSRVDVQVTVVGQGTLLR